MPTANWSPNGPRWGNTGVGAGRDEFVHDPYFHNTDIPLVPDKRDAPSWERLRELEGQVEMLKRAVRDLTEKLGESGYGDEGIPAAELHKEEWR